MWNKTTPGQGSFYRSAHELIAVFHKPGAAAVNNIELGKHGRNRTNVWTFAGVNTFQTKKGDDLALHPTVKPVAMIAEAIKDASRLKAIIFDPYLGSGTTMLAAEKVGRRCYAIEYKPHYVDVAIRRWQAFTGKDAVLIKTACSPDANTDLLSAPSGQPANHPPSPVNLTFEEVTEIRAIEFEKDHTEPTAETTSGAVDSAAIFGGGGDKSATGALVITTATDPVAEQTSSGEGALDTDENHGGLS